MAMNLQSTYNGYKNMPSGRVATWPSQTTLAALDEICMISTLDQFIRICKMQEEKRRKGQW